MRFGLSSKHRTGISPAQLLLGMIPDGAANHGTGAQNIAADSASQYNNDRTGTQFNNCTIHGACLQSLAFNDIHARHDDIAPAHRHTCDWLFDTREFQQWRNLTSLPTHNGVLWIKGKPGAGKSTLMKHALFRYRNDFFRDHLIVAFFFNAQGESLEKTPLGMLRSIVYQILKNDDILYGHFIPLFREKQRTGRGGDCQWRQSELKDFLRLVVKQLQTKPLLLLIDALDECDESEVRDVVAFLESLSIDATLENLPLRICLSSRHYPSIRMEKVLELAVETSPYHQKDIATYIREKTRRPLRAQELFAAVVGIAPPTIDIIQRRITTSSKGLIEVRSGESELVQFVHLSVSDFLFRQKRLQTLDPSLGPEPVAASHSRLWACCWSSMKQVDTTSISWQHIRESKDKDPFLEYAASHILYHAEIALTRNITTREDKQAERGEGSSNLSDIFQWLRESNCWFQWWRLFLVVNDLRKEYLLHNEVDAGLLYTLALNALPNLLRAIAEISDVNAQGGKYGSALQVASTKGHQQIVQLLLEAGANVNTQSGKYGSALQIASTKGYQQIVQLLLNAGADVNAQGGFYGNTLQAACALERGNPEIVQLLLEAGADVNAQGGEYGNALQAASIQGHQQIVQLLLEAGADVNAQGGFYGNALQAACALERGNPEIVQLLLEAGADVNAQGGEYGNALQVTSARGQQDIVQLLLEAGAEVNAQGSQHGNALQAACVAWGKDQKIEKQLLEYGTDINAQAGVFGSALQAASYCNHQEIVQLLLDSGADVNLQGGRYGNTLQAACVSWAKNQKIVKLLLEYGADVNAQGGVFGNALQAASVGGDEEIVQLLLEKGANISVQDGE
ncbi:putative ankyrin repeat protein L93 [Colletotrichum spaethianum]|uniref:Ankyrin repeat protein L93 n=1 Tax=Colletotrichum spaethianum TaxID=700344 RepID=A0AA37P794_9PEZI|nr:putative ankyrin repeat protein L93 [Colletotrichum spaethianum]GKT42724.1 putative ankyrin repeat protein L93 [Colletotrichum spaethianum]